MLFIILIMIVCFYIYKSKTTEHMTDGLNESIINKLSDLNKETTDLKSTVNSKIETSRLKHRGDSTAPYIEFYHSTDNGKRTGYVGLGSNGDKATRLYASTGPLLLYGEGSNNLSVVKDGIVMNGYTFNKNNMELLQGFLNNLRSGFIQLGSWKIKSDGSQIYFNYGNANLNSFLVGYSTANTPGYSGSTYTGASYVNGRWLG